MSLANLAARNILRNRFRTVSTIAGVAVAILAFILLRTVIWAWGAQAEAGAKDRVGTRHKVTFVMQLPLRYAEDVRQIPGVKQATFANWFGGKWGKREKEFFASFAIEHQTWLDVYDEVTLKPAERAAFMENRKAALVGENLASKFGWKVGDKVVLMGTIYPGDWEFEIVGIYGATKKSMDKSSFIFRWDYLNDALPEGNKDTIGWIVSRIDDPTKTAAISQAIDARFDERDIQTLSMSEQAMNASFLGMFATILKAIDVVSIVILAIMMLILGNTIAMGVRERTNEYGVLRALGFSPGSIAFAILGEAAVTGALGGLLGVAVAYPFVDKGVGAWLTENMGAYFPYFNVQTTTALAAMGLAVMLGVVAALSPARKASTLDVVTALRRVG